MTASIEQELRDCKQELEEIKAEYAGFVYVISHDLKAPFRQIGGFADLLSDRYEKQLDDKGCEFIDHMKTSAARGQEMIEALLTFSRVNTLAEPPIETDLQTCVDAAIADLSELMQASNATIHTDILPTLCVDAKQITQLFWNLLKNALLFQEKDNAADIQISVDAQNGYHHFCVRDNGIGIPPNAHERMFTILRRGVREEDYPGFGVGLTIARKIVQRHGGNIWLESVMGQGTSVHFTLPDRNT